MVDAIPTDIGQEPELAWVDLDLIFVDSNYQRPQKPLLVKKILTRFDWRKFGSLSLSAHADGRYAVVEGQQRLAAARLHPDVTRVPAAIFKANGAIEEAEVFLGINGTRQAVTPVEQHWAAITAGDERAMLIRTLLGKAGCSVVPEGGGIKPGQTNAVKAVSRAIDRYGEKAVLAAIVILRRAWPTDKNALSGILITGLSRLCNGNGNINIDRMVAALSEIDRLQLTADAESFRKMSGGAPDTAICKAMVEYYNRGLSKNTIGIGVRA